MISYLALLFLPEPYGIFRDELYYLACASRLAFGYVDHPPLCALLLAINRAIFGDSLFALRLLPALFGTAVWVFTALTVREMGGRRSAMTIAVTTVMVMPVMLALNGFYSMNSFDCMAWSAAVYLFVRLINNPSPGLWAVLGITLGLGLLNKISVLFLGFGFVVGILCTPQRKWLREKWFYLSGVLALILFLPYILWQNLYDWPTLEFIHNAETHKNLSLSPLQFFSDIILQAQPFALPIWLLGLWFYFFSLPGKPFRLLGWIFIAIVIVFLIKNAKPYYLAPAMPMLTAGGAVWLEKQLERFSWNAAIVTAIVILLLIGGAITAPLAIPVLPPQTLIAYMETIGIHPKTGERGDTSELPQIFADSIGWQAMADAVGKVYQSLPQEDRERCSIIVGNYGEAGALEYFGKAYHLPVPLCGHNHYYLWSRELPLEDTVIVLGSKESFQDYFESIEEAGTIHIPYSREFSNPRPIYILRHPKISAPEALEKMRHFI